MFPPGFGNNLRFLSSDHSLLVTYYIADLPPSQPCKKHISLFLSHVLQVKAHACVVLFLLPVNFIRLKKTFDKLTPLHTFLCFKSSVVYVIQDF